MMKKLVILLLATLLPCLVFASQLSDKLLNEAPREFDASELYQEMNLSNVVSYDAFQKAIEGLNRINVKNKQLLTLIDYSKPSTEERFYIFDVQNKKLLQSSLVAHGKQSGLMYASSFSNKMNSHKSSLGFYVTESTYIGHNGYSLVLDGLEKGIDDKAKERNIVIHGADYASEHFIAQHGYLGRSYGCPALPRKVSKDVIDTIKDGTLVYIYGSDPDYFSKSTILSHEVEPS